MQKYVVLDYHHRLVEDCTDGFYCGRKLEEWDDEDNFGPSLTDADRLGPGPQGAGANPNSRVVVLRHMFTLEELEKDATLLLDLKEDVREECETLGEVTNVVLYDVRVFLSFYMHRRRSRCINAFVLTKHLFAVCCLGSDVQKEPEGVMTVKFRDPVSAQACVIVRLLPSSTLATLFT